jgi:hypothetical protein
MSSWERASTPHHTCDATARRETHALRRQQIWAPMCAWGRSALPARPGRPSHAPGAARGHGVVHRLDRTQRDQQQLGKGQRVATDEITMVTEGGQGLGRRIALLLAEWVWSVGTGGLRVMCTIHPEAPCIDQRPVRAGRRLGEERRGAGQVGAQQPASGDRAPGHRRQTPMSNQGSRVAITGGARDRAARASYDRRIDGASS